MKVVIFGLGSYKEGSGISSAKFFISRGDEVLITDLKSEKDLARQIAELKSFCKKNKKSVPKFVLGKHREADILGAGMVVRNPGVPKDSKFLKLAEEKNIPVETDISIFMKNCPAQVVGVTGTRGKSTTATLIYELLKKSPPTPPFGKRGKGRRRVWLGGNIKVSPLSFIDKVKKGDVVVLELSSWLLENFREKKIAPHIAVVTNIYPDHLNTYKNMAEYVAAKKNIFACQNKNDFLILNGENSETKKWKGFGRTIYFSKKDAAKYKTNLLGGHNLENIAAALAVAKIFQVPEAIVKKVLREFKGLPDRQELVAEIRGVKYINDTTATSPDGAIAALRTFGNQTPPNLPLSKGRKRRGASPSLVKEGLGAVDKNNKNIILIAGGKDKELDYGEMSKETPKYCKAVILFPGTATDKIKPIIHNTCYIIQNADSMADAVKKASTLAKRGDIVILSPGAASFGLFKNEFDRGEKFKKAVKNIK